MTLEMTIAHPNPTAEDRRLRQEVTTLRRQLEAAEQRTRRPAAGMLVPAPETRDERKAREAASELRTRIEGLQRQREQLRVQVVAQVDLEFRPARLAQIAIIKDLADQLAPAVAALVALDQRAVAAGGQRPDGILGAFGPTWKVERERLQRAGWLPEVRVEA